MSQGGNRDSSQDVEECHGQLRNSESTITVMASSSASPNSSRKLSYCLALPILIVALFISLTTCMPMPTPTEQTSNQIPNLSEYPILIVISYDGFRYNFFEGTETPYMDEIGYNGVRTVMKNEFPTKTFPNHQSIVTGLHPESHGVTENHVYDPQYGKTLGADDEKLWVYSDDVVPAWILNEWAGGNRTSGTMMWPGCEFGYGANKSHPTFHEPYNTSIPYDIRIETILSWIIHPSTPANLVFVHFEEPDATSHAWSPNSTQTKAVIELMDNVTGHLIERLKQLDIFDKINLMLLSDHGFHSVRARDIINITELVDPTDPKLGYKKYGGSPVVNVDPVNDGEEVLEALYTKFQQASRGCNFSVYKKSEMNHVKPYWHFYNNRRIMPLVLVADPGYVFDDFYDEIVKYYEVPPYNHKFSINATYGTHGYDNHELSMHPFFMAHGPLFHKDGREVSSFNNIDLFPLFAYVAGFEPPPSNGTQDAIKWILYKERHQIHLGAQGVGWIVVIAVIFGLMILSVILSFLRQKPRGHTLLKPNGGTNAGYRFVNTKGDYEDDDYFEDSEMRGLVGSNSDEDEDHLDSKFVKVTHAQAHEEDNSTPDYIHVQDFKAQAQPPQDDSLDPPWPAWPDSDEHRTSPAPGAVAWTPTPTSAASQSQVDRNMNHTSVLTIASSGPNLNAPQSPSGTSGTATATAQGSVPIPLINMLDDEDVEEFEAPVAKKKSTPGRTYRVTFA